MREVKRETSNGRWNMNAKVVALAQVRTIVLKKM